MERKIQLNIYLPAPYREGLQRLAAQRMLEDPKKSATASKIAMEILCDFLNKSEKKEGE